MTLIVVVVVVTVVADSPQMNHNLISNPEWKLSVAAGETSLLTRLEACHADPSNRTNRPAVAVVTVIVLAVVADERGV